ncbi:hypothetical protein Tco_0342379, partial [Tanacetum coccineum]
LEEDVEVGLTRTGVDIELGISDGDEVGDHVEIGMPGMTQRSMRQTPALEIWLR